MTLKWLKIISAESPMPKSIAERANLIDFADAHHVLGQMAVAWAGKAKGKMKDVLENGLLRTEFDHRMLQFEMDRLERSLEGTGVQPVLLKGAAYVACGTKAGEGRRVSDIDVLVCENELAKVEECLINTGWAFDLGVDNDYDLYYYRKYMHELPPLRHNKRRTIIDVHHSLLPRTSRMKIRTDLMLKASISIEGRALRVLQPIDMFIHSAVHSFADGSFDTPARSILELHYLLQHLNVSEINKLIPRAEEVGGIKATATALWALSTLYQDETAASLFRQYGLKPVSSLVRYALTQKINNVESATFAKFLLFTRSHFLRMPLHLLLLHLGRKFMRRALKLIKKADPQES